MDFARSQSRNARCAGHLDYNAIEREAIICRTAHFQCPDLVIASVHLVGPVWKRAGLQDIRLGHGSSSIEAAAARSGAHANFINDLAMISASSPR
jgi:hypothetical protein